LAADADRLEEREQELEQVSEELPSTQNILRDKNLKLQITQKELSRTNEQLKVLNGQLADANKDLQSARSRLGAAERRLSAARGQLRHTETQLAELTRPNGLVGNVKRLKSELENTQIQLVSHCYNNVITKPHYNSSFHVTIPCLTFAISGPIKRR
jgi:chromosome segregation ATPase